jgi:hypothetical protein
MAQSGDVMEHPSFGAQVTFLETSEQTNGELLRVEVVLRVEVAFCEVCCYRLCRQRMTEDH